MAEALTTLVRLLIVGEIQDLARQPCLDVLDLLVTGGFHSGRILLFGDFERQAIYDRGDQEGDQGHDRHRCEHQ